VPFGGYTRHSKGDDCEDPAQHIGRPLGGEGVSSGSPQTNISGLCIFRARESRITRRSSWSVRDCLGSRPASFIEGRLNETVRFRQGHHPFPSEHVESLSGL